EGRFTWASFKALIDGVSRSHLSVLALVVLVAVACGDSADPLASWPDQSIEFEAEVLELINQRREEGATCGGETREPTHALVMEDRLQRAARLHSYDMFDRMFFSHTNPDGDGPT